MRSKKLISGVFVVLATVLGVLYACKKDADRANPVTAEEQKNQSQSLNTSARLVGAQTIYSRDSSGVHYKMVVIWNGSGGVSVNRSIVTSGYPSNTNEIFAIDNTITRTQLDLNTDTTSFDTLKVTLDPAKHYYQIKFDFNQTNPAPLYNLNPMGYNLSCSCSGGGTACSLRRGSGWSYYCQGCTKCGIWARAAEYEENDPESTAMVIPSGGVYFVEATSVTIIH